MAAIDWPASLQQCPLVNNFAIQRQDRRIHSPTETGPGKMRRRQSHAVRIVPVTICCDDTDMATLNTFVDDTTLGGALRFNWATLDSIIGGTHEYQFAQGALPSFQPFGIEWQASFTLKVW